MHELLELMITESDNTSGDALMKMVGGPAAVERRMSAWGFKAIHVNRYEGDIAFEMVGVTHPPPADEWTLEMQYRLISEVPPADVQAARARYTRDPRDTATPDDMAALLARLQRGSLLPRPFTDLLLDLMARVKTGPQRLKGRLPPDTIVAHKTGTTDVVMNDVGLITLPDGGGHLAMAVFTTNGRAARGDAGRDRGDGRGGLRSVHGEAAAASREAEEPGREVSPEERREETGESGRPAALTARGVTGRPPAAVSS